MAVRPTERSAKTVRYRLIYKIFIYHKQKILLPNLFNKILYTYALSKKITLYIISIILSEFSKKAQVKILPVVTVLLLLLLAGGVGFLIKSNLEEKESNESGKSSFYKYNLKVRIMGAVQRYLYPKLEFLRKNCLKEKLICFCVFVDFSIQKLY